MTGSIEDQADVYISHGHPMSNTVLLQGLTVQDSNLQCPKARNGIEDHCIPPEPLIQNLSAELFITKGLRKGGSWIS